jgi:hypothetical protein
MEAIPIHNDSPPQVDDYVPRPAAKILNPLAREVGTPRAVLAGIPAARLCGTREIPIRPGAEAVMIPASQNIVTAQPSAPAVDQEAAEPVACVLTAVDSFVAPAINATGSFRVADVTCWRALPLIYGEQFVEIPGMGTIALTAIQDSGLVVYRNLSITNGTTIPAEMVMRQADLRLIIDQAAAQMTAQCQCDPESSAVLGFWASTEDGLRLYDGAAQTFEWSGDSEGGQSLGSAEGLEPAVPIVIAANGSMAVVISASVLLTPQYNWESPPDLETVVTDSATFALKVGSQVIGRAKVTGAAQGFSVTGSVLLTAGTHVVSVECLSYNFANGVACSVGTVLIQATGVR